MKYDEIIRYLSGIDLTMTRYERTRWDAFVSKIGLRLEVPFIHVTGSNGKGSTAYYIYKIYEAKGLKVALFAKPFMDKPNELVEVNGTPISNADFERIFNLHEKEIMEADLSAFEVETYIAFTYINEVRPDLAVIECGMGGVTDSTNLEGSFPLLSIITSVSLEHTAFLGRTLSEIALNKSGIIKEKRPVLVGQLEESAAKVVRDEANKKDAPYHVVDSYHHDHYASPFFRFDYRPYTDLAILTEASYQLKNASLAVEATKILGDRFSMDEISVRKGLGSPTLPGRLERHGNVYIDGAHNPEAVEALTKCFGLISRGKPIHVLFASFKDKNIAVELPALANNSADITLTTFSHPRARDEEDYFLYEADFPYREDFKMALADLLVRYPDDIIVVTGSLAFAYEARKYCIEVLKI
jgi:dihydrofolate synthase/folylpolyglutamate synthase